MFKSKLDRHHVSDIDKLLAEFDKNHPQKTLAQQAEIDKHEKIFDKRDNAIDNNDDQLWD